MTQQDDYFYEIQLTNKQLVFYFMAGAAGLILSFLAGVMVGRGVAVPADAQAARVAEERVVTEETPKPISSPAGELTYAQRLESDKPDEGLERGRPRPGAVQGAATSAPTPAATATPTPAPTPRSTPKATPPPRPTAKPTPPATRGSTPAPTARATPPTSAASAEGSFSVQVGAFKDRVTAESVVKKLKTKGYSAFLVSPDGSGLYNVRVGSYEARADAERVEARLRDEEKYKPFIVRK